MSWRPLLHVRDLAKVAARACSTRRTSSSEARRSTSAPTTQNYLVRELAEILAEVTGCEVEFAGDASPDPRSYRVDFSALGRAFPDLELDWDARRGAEELVDAYRAVGLDRRGCSRGARTFGSGSSAISSTSTSSTTTCAGSDAERAVRRDRDRRSRRRGARGARQDERGFVRAHVVPGRDDRRRSHGRACPVQPLAQPARRDAARASTSSALRTRRRSSSVAPAVRSSTSRSTFGPARRRDGAWFGVRLDPESGRALYVPEGCAHGFQTLVDETDVAYMISTPYAPDSSGGVRWDDPALRDRVAGGRRRADDQRARPGAAGLRAGLGPELATGRSSPGVEKCVGRGSDRGERRDRSVSATSTRLAAAVARGSGARGAPPPRSIRPPSER